MNGAFKTIPNYPNYKINEDGTLINISSGKILKGSINPAGYLLYRITNSDGVTKTWGAHRLVLYTFDHNGFDDKLYVNHIDGVKSNNHLSNLEWVTPRGNVEHAGAIGLSSKCIPISTLDRKTSKIISYPSVTSCSKELGLTKDQVLWRLRSGEDVQFPEGLSYRRSNKMGEWKEVRVKKDTNDKSRAVLIKFVSEGVELRVDSLTSILKIFDYSLSSLSKWINDPDQPLLPNGTLISWEDEFIEWRVIKDSILELDKTNGSSTVVVFDIHSEEIELFGNLNEVALKFGKSKSTIKYWVDSKFGKVIQGKRFGYYKHTVPVDGKLLQESSLIDGKVLRALRTKLQQ